MHIRRRSRTGCCPCGNGSRITPPAEDATAYTTEWSDFETSVTPVLTLFGAYDSGKSSLLRRLLVDSGSICPNWLTISGRHETFEVSSVEAAGLLIRDTPGLSPEADDPRGMENNRRALNAAALTDTLLGRVSQ